MLKERLVGTGIGRAAAEVRDLVGLLHAILFHIEAVGTLANDRIARHLVTHLCGPGKVFLDVGAHIGSVVADVRRRDRSIRIVAIEAVPEKAARLRLKFPGLEVHACAVGESEGTVPFFVDIRRPGYSSLSPASRDGSLKEIAVPLRRLDDVVTTPGVDVMKVDVEGAELRVLQGSERLVARDRCVIMFESAPSSGPDASVAQERLWRWLNDHGYLVFVPNRVAHDGPPLSCEGFVESHQHPRRATNYFAVPSERRIEVRDRSRRLLGLQ
jgi:FkbM family methyltransferase